MSRIDRYQENIGNKFDRQGNVRYFPGNTVISFIQHDSPAFGLVREIRGILQESEAGDCFCYLPDDSIHMTVIQGVCDQHRKAQLWTKLLPLNAPLEQVDKLFEERFAQVQPLGNVRMRTAGLKADETYGIYLQPETDLDAQRLLRYRDDVSAKLGVRFPDHDSYRYHISICYGVRTPTAEQNRTLDKFEKSINARLEAQPSTFDIAEPNLTYFRSMFRFEKERFDRP
ncbi:MAG: DUF1868 domain-containing protein [Clostridia bacterium]|nr:DUF1868 domain-containing protein [Clostridia bacterium]